MVTRKRICGCVVMWIGLSVEWLLWLYCVRRDAHVWLLLHDMRTLFRDCERGEIVQSLVPIMVLLVLCIGMAVRKHAIYVNVSITFLKSTRQLRLCWLKLLHKHILGGALTVLAVACASCGFFIVQYREIENRHQYLDEPMVIHAMGKIDENAYTNSLEAFEMHYANGQRVFETDFSVTSDGKLVGRHDWGAGWQEGIDENHIPTESEFLEKPIYGKYTPLSIENIIELMKTRDDVVIVTDSKDSDFDAVRDEITLLVDTAKAMEAEEVLQRFAIQIYTPEMYEAVSGVYDFKNIIFTLYQIWNGDEESFVEFCRFCKSKGIRTLTADATRVMQNPQLGIIVKEYELELYVHTVNEQEEAVRLSSLGVDGIYTDDEKVFAGNIFERRWRR